MSQTYHSDISLSRTMHERAPRNVSSGSHQAHPQQFLSSRGCRRPSRRGVHEQQADGYEREFRNIHEPPGDAAIRLVALSER
jgi:hypothetical protein